MGKVSNVISMMNLLNSKRKYSIDELSKILEVTPRMVRFYKEELDKAGIYIDTIRGPYGGYVLNQTIRIPERKFNTNDVKIIDKLIAKDKNNLDLVILGDKIRGIYQGSKNEANELNLSGDILAKYNLVSRALKEKRKIKILYYSYNKGENERIIHPYDLFLYHDGWGVAAYCESRSDLRHFELKRVRTCELLNEFYK